jgi:hypothetical protein
LSTTLLPFATGLVLWAFSDWISGRLAAEPETPLSAGSLDLAAVHRLAVSLLGLWLIVEVLPELIQVASLYVSMRFARPPDLPHDEATDYRIWTYAQAGNARFASLLARLLIGLALYFGPSRMSHATVRGLRRFFGPPAPEAND